jgi:hypothetical protein
MEYWTALKALFRPSVTKPLRGILTGALLGILALTALVSVRIASDFIKEFQLQTAAKREAQLAAADGRPESVIRSELLQKAQALGVPLTPQAIHIHATPPPPPEQTADGNILSALGISTPTIATGHVEISIAYDVPYRYPGGTTAVHFHFAVSDHDI